MPLKPASANRAICAGASVSSTLICPYGMTTSGCDAAARFVASNPATGVSTHAIALRGRYVATSLSK